MGQCVSRKAGAVVAASGHHNSPSYRIMDKAQKQVNLVVPYAITSSRAARQIRTSAKNVDGR